ncbi:MAG TPA: Rieske 2Fe-2S domain-containing protein [Candidatus Binataceae bacterium]|nr:Rieske 2Fe-2S domain-containing protein [Candidatus Binataceae bacterium]
MEPTANHPRFVRAASLAELPDGASRTVTLEGNVIALFNAGGKIFAVDNRCPHMGFPLDRGTVKDCILTCHWHHARFDLATGGTFDQWADDVRAFPVKIEGGEVIVDLAEHRDLSRHYLARLNDGLERDIPLVIAKSVIALSARDEGGSLATFRAGLDFGVAHRRDGWGAGLTTLTCMMNLLPSLDARDRQRALYQGLSSVAADCDGNPPRFMVRPLPGAQSASAAMLKGWLRSFVEVRDAEGAERCITSAVRAGVPAREVADMMFAAATDHRYLSGGHVLDFTNKAFEALDHAGSDRADAVLASLARSYAMADRMEEANAWRSPVDLVAIVERAFESIADALAAGRRAAGSWTGREGLAEVILGDDPQAVADSMLAALREGCSPADLGGAAAYAASMRIARFHISNEFGDWDTAHHSYTFSNAVHQALRRAPSVELIRGAFDAAMSVYLDRFLNVPATRIPRVSGAARPAAELIEALPSLLNLQQQVNEVAAVVAEYFGAPSSEGGRLIAAVGHAMLREDRDFHTIQDLEAAVRQYSMLPREAGANAMISTARYLAAHSPTVRAQGQTYQIAERLFRGDRLFEE